MFSNLSKLEIRFKSGKSLILICKDWKLKKNNETGKIVSIDITGIRNFKAIPFIDLNEVELVIEYK